MKTSSSLVALALVMGAGRARAEEPSRVEFLVGAGIDYRFTTAIDLAEEAGASGYGARDDTTGRGALGLELRGGVLLPFELELDGRGVIAIGSLDLDDVERRYFGSTDTVGSTLSASLDGSALYAPALGPGLRLLAGPALGWRRMSASSGVGMARIDLVGVGVDAGLRFQLSTFSGAVDGQLEIMLRARRELPQRVFVGQRSDDFLFEGSGHGPAIYSFGLGVSYVLSFHDS